MLSDKAVTFTQLHQLYCEHIRNTVTGTTSPLPNYDLLDALKLLTQSSNERAGRKHKDTYIFERLAYLVSVITFCANGGHCSIPLHVLLTDYIDANGGSVKVITILNRFGAVASIETLIGIMMKVSVQGVVDGFLKDLNIIALLLPPQTTLTSFRDEATMLLASIQIIQPQQMLKSLAVA